MGDFFCFEVLISLDHQEIEAGLLSVAKEQVLADHSRCYHAVNVRAGFHCLERLMINFLIPDPE